MIAAIFAHSGVAVAADNDAGPSPSAADKTLPQIVVTGSATPDTLPKPYAGGQVARGGALGMLGNKDVMDTPFNTASYTEQLIRDQQARSVSDVLNNNPSVRVIYPDNDGSTDFIVRGNTIKSLDIAYDGLYGIGTPGIESLERIEFLSGANALLNGLGPIGGVGGMINQVPKKALETPLTRFTGSYISRSQFGGQMDVSRRFGEDKQFGMRFNVAYRNGNSEVSKQSQQVDTATLALDYRGSDFRLSSNFGYRHNDSESPARTTYVNTGFNIPAPPSDPKASWQQAWTYDVTDTTFGTIKGEYDITPDVVAYAAIGGSRFEEKQLFANSSLMDAKGTLLQRQVYWPLYRNSATAEAGLRGTLNTGPVKNSWSFAASTLKVTNGILLNTLSQNLTNIYNPVVVPEPSLANLAGPGDVPKTGESNLSGLALADTLSVLDDRIQLTLGVRQQKVGVQNFSTSGALSSRYDKDATTYAAGINVKPLQNLSVYANYIEGLQPGPVAPAGSKNFGEAFSPYVSKQYEIGAKYDSGHFLTTLSVYQLTTPNGQTNPSSLVYSVDGEQRTRGIELNIYGEIVSGVRLLGGVAFINAVQTSTAGGVNNGKKVTGAPDTQLNLGVEWDPQLLAGLTLSGRAIYTDSQFIDAANKQSAPSWVRYDVGARYKTDLGGHATTFRFNVENLLNKSFWAEATQGYLIQSRPRTYVLSASVDF